MRILRMTCCVAILVATAGQARGGLILDQSFEQSSASTGFGVLNGESIYRAQTFTVGESGVLDHIEVLLRARTMPITLPVQMHLLSTVAGVPDTVLANASVPASNIPVALSGIVTPAWVSFDFNAFNITVTPGEVLAFALSVQTSGTESEVSGLFGGNGGYAGGSTFTKQGLGAWTSDGNGLDYSLRTYVNVTNNVVPEPTSMSLFALGTFGIGALARRRRRRVNL